mmetsp:Transcript_12554/g.15115  ORF Transcript_12554/g.15115 Transcript_12554/m.15115 type:complete len:324 (-) Transcript_12554:12-983(-)
MHNRLEQLHQTGELIAQVQPFEVLAERLQVVDIVVSLDTRLGDLLAKTVERGEVSALCDLKDLDDLADLWPAQLLVNGVKVLSLGSPEVELDQWSRILSILECCFGVGLEYIFNLTCPCNDRALQYVNTLLVASVCALLSIGAFAWWQRQQGLSLCLADGHVNVSDELVQVICDLLADNLRPALLVPRVTQERQIDLLGYCTEMFKGTVVKLAVQNLFADVLVSDGDGIELQEVCGLLLELSERVHHAVQFLLADFVEQDTLSISIVQELLDHNPGLILNEECLPFVILYFERGTQPLGHPWQTSIADRSGRLIVVATLPHVS